MKKIIIISIVTLLAAIMIQILTEWLVVASIKPETNIDTLYQEALNALDDNPPVSGYEESACFLIEGSENKKIYPLQVHSLSTKQTFGLCSKTYVVSLEDNTFIDGAPTTDIGSAIKAKLYMTLHYYPQIFGKMKLVAISAGWQNESDVVKSINGTLQYHELVSDAMRVGHSENNVNENFILAKTHFLEYGSQINANLRLSFQGYADPKQGGSESYNMGYSLHLEAEKVNESLKKQLEDKSSTKEK